MKYYTIIIADYNYLIKIITFFFLTSIFLFQ